MKGKRMLQSLLVLCMTLFLAPAVVHAEEKEAQIGETEYTTLQEAINAAQDGDTIQLLKDVNVAGDLKINKKITITGKNSGTEVYKISVPAVNSIEITESGSLTVQDLSADINSSGETFIKVKGTFIMQPGTLIHHPGSVNSNQRCVEVFSTGTFTMNGGTVQGGYTGVCNNGTFMMKDGVIKDGHTGVINGGTFTLEQGTVEGSEYGVYNEKFEEQPSTAVMNGGTIRNSRYVVSIVYGTFTMNGGTISNGSERGVDCDTLFKMNGGTIENCGQGVKIQPNATFTMTAGKIINSSSCDVENMGTFTRTVGDTEVMNINTYNGAVYKEVDPVRKPDSQWKPVTPEEKRSFACRGGEPVNYTAAKENTYEVIAENALQGPKCFVSFDAVKGDYTVARTYDIYPAAGKKYSEEKPARICLEIPAALRKDGRSFRMICVSEDGRPFVLTDLDTNPATVTFETNHFYAFALSYK